MDGHKRKTLMRIALPLLLVTMIASIGALAMYNNASAAQAASSTCQLNSPTGKVKHVIYVQFDNVHFRRDNPNIPSDLEQMPNLLNFMVQNGTLLTNHHTPLIAHTGTDILTSLTGVYGDRHGQPISNSYRYFNPDGTTNPAVSFAYWTAPLYDPISKTPTDQTYTMVDEKGKNTPAPWVPYTRAGCNFGAVATANTVLENTAIDIPTVFGANSPEAAEVAATPAKAQADFVGIGIHCANNNAVCANGGRPDLLPDEPGGYTGYQGLFGHKYVGPEISPDGPLTDLNGNIIQDKAGNQGFPGFDGMSANVSLAYVAAMQEHNVPVTYAYISDAHDNHTTVSAYGPGEAGYVQALKNYDDAFGKFFDRLAKDGINSSNTTFVFTSDENDHFVGGAPSPANCDGITVPCTYNQIGEINVNATGLLATQQNITTKFGVHADSAPNFYINGNPARTDAVTRDFERGVAALTVTNPLTNQDEQITNYLADPVEMKLLHMVTADPARTPTFTMFAKPDYYVYGGAADCSKPCVTEPKAFAWNHGDFSPDINVTWLGIVGPGVKNLGVNNSVWSDHTDIRPTILSLIGLKDDYRHDGRVLFEVIERNSLPAAVRANPDFYIHLAQIYKQINAPVGELGQLTLKISTQAIESTTPDDSTYNALENQLQLITVERDATAGAIIDTLETASFGGTPTAQLSLLMRGQALLNHASALVQ